jgi:hypothetical protein
LNPKLDDAASQPASASASAITPMTAGGPEASDAGWAIDLQETLCLTMRARSTSPMRAVESLKSPTVGDEAPEPNLGWRPLAITLLCCLLLLFAAGALDGMQQYARIHAQVDDARCHLLAAQSLLRSRQPGQPLDSVALAHISSQLAAAQTDFDELQTELGSPAGVVLLGSFLPRLSSRIAAATDLARSGDDALQGVQSLIAASNDILAMRADGYLDANGNLTQLGRLSPAATLLFLHLRADLASAVGPLDAANVAVTPLDFALLPSTLIGSSDLVALNAQRAAWPRTRAQLLTGDGWRLLLPFVLGIPPTSR